MSSFHKSNFGRFGDGITTDLAGYAHTTAEGWLDAPMDAAGGELTAEVAEELAAQTVEQLHCAEDALNQWRMQEADGIDAWLATSIGKRMAYKNGANWYDCYEADGTFLGTVASAGEALEEYGCVASSQG